jgi:hypothetical protein
MKEFLAPILIGCGLSMVGGGLSHGFTSNHWNVWTPFIIVALIITQMGIYLFIKK